MITTSNSVANVEIRHKLNTGAVGGTIYTKGNDGGFGTASVGVLGHGIWSKWMVLGSHVGVVNVTIVNEYPNDIGVISEVKYYK